VYKRQRQDVVTESMRGDERSAAGLELADVRALLADRLRGRPTRANFRTGHLTICTLVPMRSVPHRVVCILGLEDGESPRRTRRDGDGPVVDATAYLQINGWKRFIAGPFCRAFSKIGNQALEEDRQDLESGRYRLAA